MVPDHHRRLTFAVFLNSDPNEETHNHNKNNINDNNDRPRDSTASTMSSDLTSPGEESPYSMSPWNNQYSYSPYDSSPWSNSNSSPYTKSPWCITRSEHIFENKTGLIGTIFREEGHVYSLAAAGDLLYTGSESKNIRVWKNLEDYAGFKSNSGFVKAIVISGDRILTGHQDGKIRIWKAPATNSGKHKRVGTLPSFKDFVTKSMNPKNYVEVRRKKNVLKIRHYDAVSCLSLDRELGLLYSGSWDKTVKVWRLSDSKCLESVVAHDDAVNAVTVAGFDGLVLTGSADGRVKAWKRVVQERRVKHVLAEVLLEGDTAVTAVASVNQEVSVVYAGLSDGTVRFWAREKFLRRETDSGGRSGGALRGHGMAVLCLAAAGRMVLSGSADRSICVWRREVSGAHVWMSVLADHAGPVKCLAMAEEGGSPRWIVYSGSLDKSVKVWRVTEKSP